MKFRANIKSCFSKKRYSSEEIAIGVLRKVKKKRGVDLRVYYCFGCCGYHFTSQLKKRGKR